MSTDRHGPRRPKVKEMRPLATLSAPPVAPYALTRCEWRRSTKLLNSALAMPTATAADASTALQQRERAATPTA